MVGGTLAGKGADPVLVIQAAIFKTASPDAKKQVDGAPEVHADPAQLFRVDCQGNGPGAGANNGYIKVDRTHSGLHFLETVEPVPVSWWQHVG